MLINRGRSAGKSEIMVRMFVAQCLTKPTTVLCINYDSGNIENIKLAFVEAASGAAKIEGDEVLFDNGSRVVFQKIEVEHTPDKDCAEHIFDEQQEWGESALEKVWGVVKNKREEGFI